MIPTITPEQLAERLIVSGIHLELSPSLRQFISDKTIKLLRHEPRIIRVRVDLEYDRTKAQEPYFVAKGRVEIGGPDLLAAAVSGDAHQAIDQLVGMLDRALRKRHAARKEKRNHPHRIEIGGDLPKVA
jgi:putative sigma-54 modulation protein